MNLKPTDKFHYTYVNNNPFLHAANTTMSVIGEEVRDSTNFQSPQSLNTPEENDYLMDSPNN